MKTVKYKFLVTLKLNVTKTEPEFICTYLQYYSLFCECNEFLH